MALDDVIEIIETLFKIITFFSYLATWVWFGAILGRSNVTKWADNG